MYCQGFKPSKTLLSQLKAWRKLTSSLNIAQKPCCNGLHILAAPALTTDQIYHSTPQWKYSSNCTHKHLNSSLLQCNTQTFGPQTSKRCLLEYKGWRHVNEDHILKCRKLKYLGDQRREISVTPSGIVEAAPKAMQPYMRLVRFDKPIGTYLLFWPCTWSIGLAAQAGHLPDLYMLGLFGAGAFVMRGAGCIINDMWDKDIDRKVERTKLRPLASGELTQLQALVFLGANLSVALTILLQLNWFSVALGASSMLLVILYPLAKRFTNWPQIVLGLTLNWGVLLGWSGLHGSIQVPAISLYLACVLYTMIYDTIYSHQMLISGKKSRLRLEATQKAASDQRLTFNFGALLGWCAVRGAADWPTAPLYAGCLLWTLVYDTIYAHQDKYDDMLIGVRSTALHLGDQTKKWLAGFGSTMIGCIGVSGYLCDQTWPFYLALAATAGHLSHQIITVDLNNPDDCMKKFKSNTQLGAVLFLGIVLGTLLKPKQNHKHKQEEAG